MAIVSHKIDDFDSTTVLAQTHKATRVTISDDREDLSFDIDLSDENFKKLITALNKFSIKGTPVTKRTSKTNSNSDETDQDRNAEIREWAQTQRHDLKVSDRGRLSNHVINEYNEWEKQNTPSA